HVIVSLPESQHPQGVKRGRAIVGQFVRLELERLGEPPATLGEIAAALPEYPQRTGYALSYSRFSLFNRPAECRTQVVVLSVGFTQPFLLLRPIRFAPGVLGKVHEIKGVLPANCINLGALGELLPGVFPERFEHIEARLALFVSQHFGTDEEALAEKRG